MTIYGIYDWSVSHNKDYWNKGLTIYTINNQSVLKTIYDPCPTFYSVPAVAAFTGFTIQGSFNNGWYFYTDPNIKTNTIFMAAVGYRGRAGGVLFNVGQSVNRFTSGCSNTANRCFYLQVESANNIQTCVEWYKDFALPITMNKCN